MIKKEQKTDYRVIFFMGVSFIGAGVALSSINLGLGMAFIAIGMSNIIVGMNHKDEWSKK